MPQKPQYEDPDKVASEINGRYEDPDAVAKELSGSVLLNLAAGNAGPAVQKIRPIVAQLPDILMRGSAKLAEYNMPVAGLPGSVGLPMIKGIKALYDNVSNDPASVAPTVGAMVGSAVGSRIGGAKGASTGAMVGGGAGKVVENVVKGEPWSQGMVDRAAAEGAGEGVVRLAGKGLKAVGRTLVGKALAPNLSEVRHMMESAGTYARDVEKSLADRLIRDRINVNASGTRKVMDQLAASHERAANVVDTLNSQGTTIDGMAHSRAVANDVFHRVPPNGTDPAIRAGSSASGNLAAARNELSSLFTDPKSIMTSTVNPAEFSPRTLRGALGEQVTEPVAGAAVTTPSTAIPIKTAHQQMTALGSELKGQYGAAAPKHDWATKVDMAARSDLSKRIQNADPTGEVARLFKDEHELMNLLTVMGRRTFDDAKKTPLNLYQFMGAASQDPATFALGTMSRPAIMSRVGRYAVDAGNVAEVIPQIIRAAMLAKLKNEQPQ
jgi:hypothetical protein